VEKRDVVVVMYMLFKVRTNEVQSPSFAHVDFSHRRLTKAAVFGFAAFQRTTEALFA
jgi:hypothetical protein